jgi:hypothetical protein
MVTTNTVDDYEPTRKMPVFAGDKESFRSFMILFEGWENKEDTRKATSSCAMVDDLPGDQEYWDSSREVELIDPIDGTVQVVVEALTDEQNKLYLDNAKSKNQVEGACQCRSLGADVDGKWTKECSVLDEAVVQGELR